MVQINFKDFGNGDCWVSLRDTETLQSCGMDKEIWDEIKLTMNIDENSENIFDAIKKFKQMKYEESGDMYIPILRRR